MPGEFFARPTLRVARDLVGKRLVCEVGSDRVAGTIVEVEAYRGEADRACHASRGRTRRTEGLYRCPGVYYVYLIYGMYWCLNVVTEREDYPAAVLVRAVEPTEGLDAMRARRGAARRDEELTSGPGKLCQAYGIDGSFHGDHCERSRLFVEDAPRLPDRGVGRGPRVGVDYAGECRDHPWRFCVRGNPFVSRPRL